MINTVYQTVMLFWHLLFDAIEFARLYLEVHICHLYYPILIDEHSEFHYRIEQAVERLNIRLN